MGGGRTIAQVLPALTSFVDSACHVFILFTAGALALGIVVVCVLYCYERYDAWALERWRARNERRRQKQK